MNKVMLIGNVTRDPELKRTQNGIACCTFGIAVNRNYNNAKGGRDTDFINITVWRGAAETCAKYLSKGRKVAVTGSLQTRNYEDKAGNKRYTMDVVGEDIEFLPSKAAAQAGGTGTSPPQESATDPKTEWDTGSDVTLDELPF